MDEEKDEEVTRIPPVSPQEKLMNVEVISTGKKGEGVAKYEGYIIFIEGAKVGEKVDITIDKVFKNFALANILKEEEENEGDETNE